MNLNLSLKRVHTQTLLTNVILVYCEINNFIGLFYEYFTFIRRNWKKKSIFTVK